MSAGTILFLTYIVAPVLVVVGLFGYLAHSEGKRYTAALAQHAVTKDEMRQLERTLKKADKQYRQADQMSLVLQALGLLVIVGTFHQAIALLGGIVAGVVFTLARRFGKQSIALEAKYFKAHKEFPKIAEATWTLRTNLVKYHWLMGMALSIAAFLFSFATFIK